MSRNICKGCDLCKEFCHTDICDQCSTCERNMKNHKELFSSADNLSNKKSGAINDVFDRCHDINSSLNNYYPYLDSSINGIRSFCDSLPNYYNEICTKVNNIETDKNNIESRYQEDFKKIEQEHEKEITKIRQDLKDEENKYENMKNENSYSKEYKSKIDKKNDLENQRDNIIKESETILIDDFKNEHIWKYEKEFNDKKELIDQEYGYIQEPKLEYSSSELEKKKYYTNIILKIKEAAKINPNININYFINSIK